MSPNAFHFLFRTMIADQLRNSCFLMLGGGEGYYQCRYFILESKSSVWCEATVKLGNTLRRSRNVTPFPTKPHHARTPSLCPQIPFLSSSTPFHHFLSDTAIKRDSNGKLDQVAGGHLTWLPLSLQICHFNSLKSLMSKTWPVTRCYMRVEIDLRYIWKAFVVKLKQLLSTQKNSFFFHPRPN